MVQFYHLNKYYAAFAVSGLLCACAITSSAQVRDTVFTTDTVLNRQELVYSVSPRLRAPANRYLSGQDAALSNKLIKMKPGTDAASKNLAVLAKMPSLNNLSAKSLLPSLKKPSLPGAQPVNSLKQPGALSSLSAEENQVTSFFSADTSKKANMPKVQLPSAVTTVPQFKNQISANGATVQGLTNMPLQSVKGIAGLNSKDQMTKLAAMRSQLISESISKNFSSLHHPSFGSTLTLENDFQYQPVFGSITGKKYMDIVSVSGSLMAFGLPLSINVSNDRSAIGSTSPLNSSLFKFGFSPSMLSGLLKSDLQQYADLKNSVFHGFDFTGYVHQTITEKVSSIESGTGNKSSSPFAAYLNNSEKLQGLIGMPDKEVKQQLETSVNAKYLEEIKDPNANQAEALATRNLNYQKADSMAAVINSVRTELKKSGISPDKLMLAENFLSGKTSSGFNSSEAANSLFTRKPGGAFQSLFGGIKDLRVGSFGNQVPGSTGDDAQLMNGANVGIKLGDYPLTFGYGSLNDINSAKDAGYDNSVYASPRNITYIGTEMKRGVFGDVKIAVVSSFNTQPNSSQYAAPTLPGNAVALTVTKAVKIEKFGNFSFDVSKSGTLFSSSFQPGGEALLERKAGANLSNNLFQALALGFTHNLDIPRLQASDNVYFNYAGLGYQNPANNGYSGATMKFGGDLKKSFYKNKLMLDFRTDYRSMPLSYTTNDKWKNYQVQLDSRYQFSSKLNISLKYTEAATNRNIGAESVSVYDSKKIEISGNNTLKVGKYFTVSHLSISSQSLTNTYQSATGSSLLNVNYAQSLVLKNSSLTATLFYNKELASYVLIGDMLTTDLTYQFVLFKNIQLASGVTYLNNTNIAKQFGVRQGLQVTAGKHFDFNASVDLRKNLITPQYADLYASCRGELAIRYYFKID